MKVCFKCLGWGANIKRDGHDGNSITPMTPGSYFNIWNIDLMSAVQSMKVS